jgi:hypothetical protein
MRVKTFLIASFLSTGSFVQIFAQNALPLSNEKVKYEIILVTPRTIGNDAIPSRYLIQVDLADATKKHYKTVRKEQWIRWLKDDTSDWATNLLLYSLYERDAIAFQVYIRDRKTWLGKLKTEDIEYWGSFLKE